jgi:hypothetical protein
MAKKTPPRQISSIEQQDSEKIDKQWFAITGFAIAGFSPAHCFSLVLRLAISGTDQFVYPHLKQ